MRTIASEITLSGVGLHSGDGAKIHICPYDKQGIFFATRQGIYNIAQAQVSEDSRLTAFTLPDGTSVRTAEHMLAACVGMALDAVLIKLEGEEVPILDGSSHIFAEAIQNAGYKETGKAAQKFSISAPIAIDAGKGKFIAAAPADSFQITYIIDYPNTPIGTQHASYTITSENFLSTISHARTFGLTYELDYLKKNNLARGGSLENALIFDNEKLLNEGGLRFPLELVTHKVIDLMGDLALAGCVPVAHYFAILAGHAVHRKLVERLRRLFYAA